MKVLFVSALLPYPLFSGGQIRIYNLLKLLSSKHDITLISYIRNYYENKYLSNLNFISKNITVYRGPGRQFKNIFGSIFSNNSFLVQSYLNSNINQIINNELTNNNYDLIHIEPWYAYANFKNINIPVVVTDHNVEYKLYEKNSNNQNNLIVRKLLYNDSIKLKSEEISTLNSSKCVIAVSSSDAKVLKNITSLKNIEIINNGVDVKFYKTKKVIKISDSPKLLFVGNFKWLQNVDAVNYLLKDIWPLIKNRFPKALLKIVGNNFTSQIKESINDMDASFLENVNDIRDEYNNANILIAPLRVTGGSSFKIIEAMSSGLNVLTTSEAAMGINAKDKVHLFCCDNPQSYVKAIEELNSNFDIQNRMISEARKLILSDYDWKKISEKLDKVWKKI